MERFDMSTDEVLAAAERDRLPLAAAMERLKQYSRRLERELAEAARWNHAVRVCAEHTGDVVGDGCLVCENAALREAARRAAHAANKQGAENLTQELRDAVIALEAALAQSPPYEQRRVRADAEADD
jgi:hypothetical protein